MGTGFSSSSSFANNQLQTKFLQQNIACQINDCFNGGLCYRELIDGKLDTVAKCKCKLGYGGDKCERLIMVNLQYEDSYLEFETPDLENNFNLTFQLMTTLDTGILFYHGSKNKQHMAVELFKGRIRVSYDIGNAPVSSTMFSYGKINDGIERNVQFLVTGQNFTLRIRSETSDESRSISNQGKFEYLNVGGFNEPLYMGGVPNSIKDRISNDLLHVRNASSFIGCIANVYINSHLKDLQKVEYSHKIEPGCVYKNACFNADKMCLNGGKCKSMFSLNVNHLCECEKEFSGSSCELRVNVNQVKHRALPLGSSSGDPSNRPR